ncbi:MAG: hypothetical protein KDD39_01245 [Bdellovibrionales bacterium]|nr:hypothetical protein [Bdellovibrionales bacterium]
MRLLLLMLCLPASAFAWDHHDWLTENSLKSLSLGDATAVYESLEAALQRSGTGLSVRDTEGLLSDLKLNTRYTFPNKLEEQSGATVFVKAILAKYADEPDWGADQDLFEKDQYPELWTEDTPYVSQKTGLGSQGFRHMYFSGKMNWWEPIASFQIPQHAIGEAPGRAQTYWDLAQAMKRAGAHYWAYRFLAWSLHYVQDLFQPFHSRQTPSKNFIEFKLKWWVLPGIDIEATADQIAYYHLGYEAWVTRELGLSPMLKGVLAQGSLPESASLPVEGYLVQQVVPYAASKAASLADNLIKVLPKPSENPGQKPKDEIGKDVWWQGVQTGAAAGGLGEATQDLLESLGKLTRYLVQAH